MFSVKKSFLRSYLNLPWNSLEPFALTLLHVVWKETLTTLISALNSSSCQDLPDLTLVFPEAPYASVFISLSGDLKFEPHSGGD